jgi:hypothetical protein
VRPKLIQQSGGSSLPLSPCTLPVPLAALLLPPELHADSDRRRRQYAG